jgi:hypothetical protein
MCSMRLSSGCCFFPSLPVISTQQQLTTADYHIRLLFTMRASKSFFD